MRTIKILTVVGARPQFIKLVPVSREIRKQHEEVLVHTGQHYDQNMSEVFFKELDILEPDYNLGIGSASHGEQTGRMIIGLEETIINEKPNHVIVYGDTNSTIAAALAASKLNISVIHIEAGLRSFNKRMPEEVNRVLTDHISDFLFCPTETAVDNLDREGVTENVFNVGDVMYDSVLYNSKLARQQSRITETLEIDEKKYYLATVHRAENTDDKNKLLKILSAFEQLDLPVIFPIHPRTKKMIKSYGLSTNRYHNIRFIEPVSYLDMLKLIMDCSKVLTDSGGLQKEAYFLDKQCITLRDETEWVETLKGSWNILAKIDVQTIHDAVHINDVDWAEKEEAYFGDGQAAKKIVTILEGSCR